MSDVQKPHVLVVDDDKRLRALLKKYLTEQEFIAITAEDAEDARKKLLRLEFDIIILDVMMPKESGFEFARSMREAAQEIPVLLLTARGEIEDRIEGLEAGADDYMQKPFEPKELILRLQAILKRTGKQTTYKKKKIKLGAWEYDKERDELIGKDKVIKLTGMEAGLMRIMADNIGKVLTRETILEKSSQSDAVNDRTIDVQVTRLRRKIEKDVKNPRYLVTVRGEGYSLCPDE
ncbi:MAG: response regulator transcription factor [Alphaproteobacteria bacterium]|nr:response regulator transcription factor [Alphaproteobacteria bacterium]